MNDMCFQDAVETEQAQLEHKTAPSAMIHTEKLAEIRLSSPFLSGHLYFPTIPISRTCLIQSQSDDESSASV